MIIAVTIAICVAVFAVGIYAITAVGNTLDKSVDCDFDDDNIISRDGLESICHTNQQQYNIKYIIPLGIGVTFLVVVLLAVKGIFQ